MRTDRGRAEHKATHVTLLSGDATKRLRQALTQRLNSREMTRCFFLGYCVAMILVYALWVPTMAQPGFPVWGPGDFTAFYTAAHIIRDGNAHRLYDLSLQTQVQQRFLVPHGWTFLDGLLPYNNPPFFAAIFVPLSFLPLAWAFHVWNIVNIILIIASIKLLLHHQRRRSNGDLIAASLAVFAFFPVLQGLVNGQSSFLLLFTLVLTYLALKSKQDYLAGATLALALIKPQLVVVIVAIMLYRRRWRTLLALSVTAVVLLLASLVIVGVDGVMDYAGLIRQMLGSDSFHGLHPAPMPNLRGTVYRFGQLYHTYFGVKPSSVTLKAVTLLLSVPVFVLVLRIWKGPWDATSHRFDLRFSQTVVGTLLLSPHLYSHDLTLLILVGFLLVNCFAREASNVRAHRMIAIAHVAAVLPFIFWGGGGQAQIIAFLLVWFMIMMAKETGHWEALGDGMPASLNANRD